MPLNPSASVTGLLADPGNDGADSPRPRHQPTRRRAMSLPLAFLFPSTSRSDTQEPVQDQHPADKQTAQSPSALAHTPADLSSSLPGPSYLLKFTRSSAATISASSSSALRLCLRPFKATSKKLLSARGKRGTDRGVNATSEADSSGDDASSSTTTDSAAQAASASQSSLLSSRVSEPDHSPAHWLALGQDIDRDVLQYYLRYYLRDRSIVVEVSFIPS